jgi:hypothetical protein
MLNSAAFFPNNPSQDSLVFMKHFVLYFISGSSLVLLKFSVLKNLHNNNSVQFSASMITVAMITITTATTLIIIMIGNNNDIIMIVTIMIITIVMIIIMMLATLDYPYIFQINCRAFSY